MAGVSASDACICGQRDAECPKGDDCALNSGAIHCFHCRLAEQQQRDGWYCYGCAAWLPAGKGVVLTAKHKAYSGLYCGRECANV